MAIEVGDELFGYPVIGVTSALVTIRLPGNMDVSFDASQFNAGVLEALAEIGEYVPHG